MDLGVDFLGHSIKNPLMNASGCWCDNKDLLDDLLQSEAGTFVTKSATSEYREGNPKPRYIEVPLGSINSMGLPNLGIDFYLNYSLEFQNNHPDDINFLSIAGMCMEDNLSMVKKIEQSEFKGITELNLSCPNVPGKPQIGYDFEATERILEEVFSLTKKKIGVKLPPYFDFAHFDAVSEILNKFPLSYVNCINSLGNGLYIEDDTVSIRPKDGFGGIGGAYVKPTALANVRAFYLRLNQDIAIIGCGGVESGKDMYEHILCGAHLVQVGTQLMKEGPQVFARILQEFNELVKSKGYESLKDLRGALKSM